MTEKIIVDFNDAQYQESLKDLNLDVDKAGSMILNWQMLGLLVGGILWGVLGDKKGIGFIPTSLLQRAFKEEELDKMVKFETSKQLDQFSKIFQHPH